MEHERKLSDWMKKAQEGDRLAYESLLKEARRLLQIFLRMKAVPGDWIDDVIQDSLVSIHQYRHTYDPDRPFTSWMYGIASHRLIDHMRKSNTRVEYERNAEAAREDDRHSSLSERDAGRLEELHQALGRLCAKQRDVVRMLKLDGLSIKEVASRTGSSEVSIKVSAHRAYRNLRKYVGAMNED